MMMMGEAAERIENMDLRSGKCYLNQHVYVGKAGARSNLHCLGEGLRRWGVELLVHTCVLR